MKNIFFLLALTINFCNGQTVSIGGIINQYTPIRDILSCDNAITVEDASTFKIGDTVLMIQMKGAAIDSSNSASFGMVTDYKNAGNYSFNYIFKITNNIINLKNKIPNERFNIPEGKVQLIKVPFYNSAVVTSTLTCLPWDGNKGGVLVFNVKNNLQLNADINVSGKGFNGGSISNNPDGNCGTGSPDFYYPLIQSGSTWQSGGAEKGEGIALVSPEKMAGKGAIGNGGGGGNKQNTGGGGGSGYGNGGIGGNEWEGCAISGNGGIGGKSLSTADYPRKIFLGGGGGCGDANNKVGTPGANGGGIIIIKAASITANGKFISANGNNQLLDATGIADGAGGGGGGGSILLFTPSLIGGFTIQANGGDGGNQNPTTDCVGPGGGGGGGFIAVQQSSLPPNVSFSVTKGNAGLIKNPALSCFNTSYGATDGADGLVITDLSPIIDSPFFQKDIDLVTITPTQTKCNSFDFAGSAHTNYNKIEEWTWTFGDGGFAGTQNTSHTYPKPGTYNVQLVVNNGICGASTNITVSTLDTAKIEATKSNDIDCALKTASLAASGGIDYIWSPATGLNDSTIATPVTSVQHTQQYILQGKDPATGCFGFDTIIVKADFGILYPLFIPNAFTPNGDGMNDCYRIIYDGPITKLNFSIYNRWGERVFYTTNIKDCWNGVYKNRDADEANYVYYIKVINDCREIVEYGNLVLIR
ncbi:gliding motility-associated C-terminal domain-containing protein [Ferruginibacter lapsinanis]|uniref:T9SS type B sorting domain-containing protein n=1 Tax=Ferruginibacter lapsinanis TaxID=563172 RepID=UPI001E352339|nr:gliding motility-associated C-terminal domain-containing protein [Ferruginibacter lapsinanis]UEG49043.1 gliding motility-associated C-terminal domain-containing protein [Ferruginibacter lapsinanis]